MNEPITVVEVEQVGDMDIVVIFSNGKRGRYSATLLAAINELPLTPQERLWTGISHGPKLL